MGRQTQVAPAGRRLTITTQLVVFLVGCAIVVSRRPDAFFHAQFYAEDGNRWFQDAYELGVRSLWIPLDGYLQVVSRLIAMLAQLVPLAKAPLVMNLCAIAVQVWPVNLFLSSRFSSLDLRLRLVAGAMYLALPNSFEVHANTTNIEWHLALLACLLLFATAVTSALWRALEVTTLVLISIDSPFGMLLAGMAGVLAIVRRDSWSKARCAVLLPGALVQSGVILFSHSRESLPNGASLIGLVRILARQVFAASLLGLNNVTDLMTSPWLSVIDIVAATIGIAVLVVALVRAPIELKLFILFAVSVLAAALLHPKVSSSGRQWPLLESPGAANRYYFLPIVAFLAALVWIVVGRMPRAARYGAGVLLALLPFGIWRDWTYPKFVDLNFQHYVQIFDDAPPGTRVRIPIYPPPWFMTLTKR